MQKYKHVLSLLMALTLLFPTSTLVQATEDSATNEPQAIPVREIEWLREVNSETYLMSDGTFECVVYAEDKYYSDATDNLQPIDNSIVAVNSTTNSVGQYKNAGNSFDVYFSSGGNPEVNVEYGESRITFSPFTPSTESENYISTADCAMTVGAIENCNTLSDLTPTGNNTVTYTNAFADTDLVYVLENKALKEYIVLNSSSSPNTFNFMFTLDSLSMQTIDNVTWLVSKDGTPVFALGALYVMNEMKICQGCSKRIIANRQKYMH